MTPKKRKPASISDQLRAAIQRSGLSRYKIWKRSGVDQAALSRFVNRKQSLTLDATDALAPVLGLELTSNPPQTKDR